jgi:hypothetical protein
MAALVELDCSWENQDLDLGISEEVVETVIQASPIVDTVTSPVPLSTLPILAPTYITPNMFMRNILTKSCKTYASEKHLKPWLKTVKAIDITRDKNISRLDAIRMVLQGKAILLKASIEWKDSFIPRVLEDNPILTNTTKWTIITDREKWDKEDKMLVRTYDIHVAPTKKQLHRR